MRPLVSICIPCFNQAEFVGECIASALAQTYPEVEVIVIDDGSTDESLAVIQSFNGRIRWETGPNRGAPSARNHALAISTGEYINFLDADDLLEPQKIERQLPLLVAGVADIVLCQTMIFGDGVGLRPKDERLSPTVGVDAFIYTLRHGLSTFGPLHRRSAVERVGGFTPGLRRGQEGDLHLRMTAAGARLALVDEYLGRTRHHSGSRITAQVLPSDYWLRAMIEMTDWIELNHADKFSAARRQALAGHLFQAGIYAFRNGTPDTARRAFARARALHPDFSYTERAWYKLLQPLTGPIVLEHALATARNFRDRWKGAL